MEMVNVETFKKWVMKNVKFEEIKVELYVEDLIQHVQGGKSSYELGSYETKSGHAESIDFDHDYQYDEELDELSNETITF